MEKAGNNLAVICDKLKDTDITLLHEYHRLYKKEVSFFRRTETAAWLFMYYDRNEIPPLPSADDTRIKTSDTKAQKQQNKSEKKSFSSDESPLPDEESKQLFISIGKNRRLYPREIITLIMTKAGVLREDIGIIKILDNYSFVQVRDAKAGMIIEALKGLHFRGRTLAVNYAKPKSGDSSSE